MSFLAPANMTLADFRKVLASQPGLGLRFRLPTGVLLAEHLHLTEVARVEKRFIDCGGTVRTQVSARVQLWVADDTDHRVGCAKCRQVPDRGRSVIGSEDVPFEVECDLPYLTMLPVVGTVVEGADRVVLLGTSQADCLAPEVCLPPQACQPGGGCC